ncbi:MAG: methyltransferase domain-containing protein [Bdellovibrionota bacterium]
MTHKDFWNQNADNWAQVIEQNLIASRTITNAALLNEVLSLKPKFILDIGCGEGWLSQPIIESKIDYLGIDGSSQLIEIALRRGSFFQHITYEQIINGWQPNQHPDLAILNFSLLDKDVEQLLSAVSAFTARDGKIIIQTLHPSNLPVYQDGWNEEDFKTMTIKFQGKMPWYGRTKESWLSVFDACNLKVDKITEPSLNDKFASIIFTLSHKEQLTTIS